MHSRKEQRTDGMEKKEKSYEEEEKRRVEQVIERGGQEKEQKEAKETLRTIRCKEEQQLGQENLALQGPPATRTTDRTSTLMCFKLTHG